MNKQNIIKVLLNEMRNHEDLKDKSNTKIFIPNQFSMELEEEMGVKNIKGSGLAGYDVQYGPFKNLSAYNRLKNCTIQVSVTGEVIND